MRGVPNPKAIDVTPILKGYQKARQLRDAKPEPECIEVHLEQVAHDSPAPTDPPAPV